MTETEEEFNTSKDTIDGRSLVKEEDPPYVTGHTDDPPETAYHKADDNDAEQNESLLGEAKKDVGGESKNHDEDRIRKDSNLVMNRLKPDSALHLTLTVH